MIYIKKVGNKFTCSHPQVSKIHEWGGCSLVPGSAAFRFITLTMSNKEEKIFQDYGEGKAEEEADKYLQNYKSPK